MITYQDIITGVYETEEIIVTLVDEDLSEEFTTQPKEEEE